MAQCPSNHIISNKKNITKTIRLITLSSRLAREREKDSYKHRATTDFCY